MSKTAIILASGSAPRRNLLMNAGLEVTAIKPNVDEDALKSDMRRNRVSIRDQAMHLAEVKAIKVSSQKPGLVVAGDQMLNLEGEAFDKPKTLDEAKNHLKRLSGKSHTLETAILVAEDGNPVWRHLARPKLYVRPLTDEFIESYINQTGEAVLSTVGAYQLEGLGAQIFSQIEGDFFSILGLPLLPLLDYFRVRQALPE